MSKVAKATVGLMIVTLLSKVIGFSREMVLTYAYGTTMQADAYITALSIPDVLFTAIGAALATTFIPLYNENKMIGGRERSLKFTNNIINIVIMISIIISVCSIIFAKPLVKLFAMDFVGEKLQLTINYARIMIPSIIFIGLKNIMVSYLQLNDSFVATGLVGFPYNAIVIASILISTKTSIYVLPIGTLIGMASQFIILYIVARKKEYKYKPYINLKDNQLKKMGALIAPVFIGVAVNQINSIVDKSLASTLGDGVITALNTANRLNQFVMGLFIATIVTVVYPMLSKLSLNEDKSRFIDTISKSVNSIIILVIPISVGAIALAQPIVKLLFQRGAFNEYSTYLTSSALVFYSIGLIGSGLRDILGKVFYSLQDTKTPMLNGALAMGINIVLNLILIKFMGHTGLAFATSLSSIIGILLLFNKLKQKMGNFGQDRIIKTTIKVIISAVIMGVVTKIGYNYVSNILGVGLINETISLFSSILLGIIVYLISIILMRVEEINMIIDMVKSRVSKK